MRILLLLLLAPLLLACVSTQTDSGVKGELMNYGLVQIINKGTVAYSENSISGYSENYSDMVIVETTNVIPLTKGVTFGIEWCAEGFQDNKTILSLIIDHPKTTDFLGKKRKQTILDYSVEPKNGRYCNIDGYKLSQPSELIEGVWVISIFYQEQKIAKKKFIVK